MSNKSLLQKRIKWAIGVSILAISTLLPAFGSSNDVLNFGFSQIFPSGNLIVNGSFEGNYTSFQFDGWSEGTISNPTAYKPMASNVVASPRSGRQFAGIHFAPPSGTSRFLVSDPFPLKPNTWYTFFIYYQSRFFNPVAGDVFASFKTYKDRDLIHSETPFPTPTQAKAGMYASVSDWTRYTHRFFTGLDANYGDVALLSAEVASDGGSFLFDDAYLVEGCVRVSDGETLPPSCAENIPFGQDPRHPDSIGITQNFFDGNQKAVQTLTQDGPRDIVTQVIYDTQNRPVKTTLPIGAEFPLSPHTFISGITAAGGPTDVLSDFYDPSKDVYLDIPIGSVSAEKYPDAGHVPFSESRYESSNLGRVVETAGPGASWAMGGSHTHTTSYTSVPNVDAADDPALPDPIHNAYFPNFFAKEEKGPDGQVTREITDKLGRTVRTSSKLGSHWVTTDYDYDEMGNLVSVLAPRDGVGNRLNRSMTYNPLGQMTAEATPATGTTRFLYDAAGRIRFTQTANQSSASQSQAGKFTYVKYDALGRDFESGEITDASLFQQEKADLWEFPCVSDCLDPLSTVSADLVKIRSKSIYDDDNTTASCIPDGGNSPPGNGFRFLGKDPHDRVVSATYDLIQTYQETAAQSRGQSGYATIQALYTPQSDLLVAPRPGTEISAIGGLGFSLEGLSVDSPDGVDALAAFNTFQTQYPSSVLGAGEFLHGRLVKSLTCNYELAEALGESFPREVSKTYRYDKFGNVTKTLEVNGYAREAENMTQLTLNRYDTQNRLLESKVCSNLLTDPDCSGPLAHVEMYRYDRQGRVQLIKDKADNVIVENHYNFIGQPSARSLGGNITTNSGNGLLEKTTRHLRGWLKSSQMRRQTGAEMFRTTLTYEGIGPGSRFDGNISTASYAYGAPTGLGNIRYFYGYDDLSRLNFSTVDPASTITNVSSTYTYLDDGRISRMTRDTSVGDYAYASTGQLKEITGDLVDNRDMSLATNGSFVFDFDPNGNMITDNSKSEDQQPFEIFYRSDNLPFMFSYKKPNSSGGYDELASYMAYDEGGNRVAKLQFRNDAWESNKNYFASGKEVRERVTGVNITSLEVFEMAGVGRATYTPTKPEGYKEFYLTDHLGSTREVYDFTTGALTYASHYFPYGKQFSEFNSQTKGDMRLSTEGVTKKFTGKEFDDGIDLNYFGARYYDQDIGVWISPDPMRQFSSPYSTGGDPINAVDVDGSTEYRVLNADGSTNAALTFYADDGSGDIRIVPNLSGMETGGPGFAESLIPIWGSGRLSIHNYEEGHPIKGTLWGAMAISDVALVKSLVVGGARVVGGTAWKTGSNTWRATRAWLGREGLAESGQEVHHWLLYRNMGIGKYFPNWFKNQPWNLMNMPSAAFHTALHGGGAEAMGLGTRFYYGTPMWFKAVGLYGGSRAAGGFSGD